MLDGGQALERFLPGEDARRAEAIFAGEQVVNLEADAVEGRLPPGIAGHDEGEVVDEVRRVLPEQAALLERLHDEGDVALLEIADAAVDQLGGAAGGAFAEILVLEQQTSKPRVAASTATPTPVAPPPMMTMSHGSVRALARASMFSRFMHCSWFFSRCRGGLRLVRPVVFAALFLRSSVPASR